MCCTSSKQSQTHANWNNSSILQKNKRYFSPAGDFSTFKTTLHCVMHAERSASTFHRRNKPTYTKISITRRFCRKLSDISFPFMIFRRLNALCTALCVQNVVHSFFVVGTSPDTRKLQYFVDFVENYALFLSRWRYCDV